MSSFINSFWFGDDLPTTDLVAYYKFNSDVTDEVASNDLFTLTNIAYDTGKIGNAVDMNGNAKAESPLALSYSNGSVDSAFSMNFWLYFDSISGYRWIVSKRGNNTTQCDWGFGFNSSSELFFEIYDDSFSAHKITVSKSGLSTATWYMVTITYDGDGVTDATGLKMYIDGSLDNSGVETGTYSAMTGGTAAVWYGVDGIGDPGAIQYYDGRIDEHSIWDVELTSDEVSTLWNGGSGLEL